MIRGYIKGMGINQQVTSLLNNLECKNISLDSLKFSKRKIDIRARK